MRSCLGFSAAPALAPNWVGRTGLAFSSSRNAARLAVSPVAGARFPVNHCCDLDWRKGVLCHGKNRARLVGEEALREDTILQIRNLWALVGLTAVAACASVPSLPYEKGVGVVDILWNVKCELATAYRENSTRYPWLRNWAAGVELTLDVTDGKTGGVKAQILVPIHVTDSFRMGADLLRHTRAQSVSSVTFSTALASLNEASECAHDMPERGPEPLLRGNLGLKTWISRAVEAIDAAGIAEQTDGLGYIIEFGIEQGGGLDPSFSIVRIGNYELGGSAGLAASREDTHTLNIAMAPIRPVAPAPVYVTNFGGPQPQTRAQQPGTAAPAQKRTGARPATGVPQQTQQDLSNIIRSLKQSQTGRD